MWRTNKAALAGFHARGSDRVIDIDHCDLIRPEFCDVLPMAKARAIAGVSRKGALSVQINTSEAGFDVAVFDGKPLDHELEISLTQAAEHFSLAHLSREEKFVAMHAPPIQRFGHKNVVSPNIPSGHKRT